MGILAAVAQHEREAISARTTAALAAAMARAVSGWVTPRLAAGTAATAALSASACPRRLMRSPRICAIWWKRRGPKARARWLLLLPISIATTCPRLAGRRGTISTRFEANGYQNAGSENGQRTEPAEIGDHLPWSRQRGTDDHDRNTDYTCKCGSAGCAKHNLRGGFRRQPKPVEQTRDAIREGKQAACQRDDHRGRE